MERLKKGITYRMVVYNIETKDKAIFKSGSTLPWYSHRVYFEDEDGVKYKGEYMLQEKVQKDFRVGLKYTFHCTFEGEFGDEIQIGVAPSQAPNQEKKAPAVSIQKEDAQEHPYQVRSMSGQGYVFAMSYAKDVYCSLIAAGMVPKEEVDDMSRMIIMAKEINAALIEMQQAQLK